MGATRGRRRGVRSRRHIGRRRLEVVEVVRRRDRPFREGGVDGVELVEHGHGDDGRHGNPASREDHVRPVVTDLP